MCLDYFKTLWMCVDSCQVDMCYCMFPNLVFKNDVLAADPFHCVAIKSPYAASLELLDQQ